MASAWLPPVEPWSPAVKDSFAFKSVSQRWPKIITSAIDALFQASYALSYSSERQLAESKIQESKELVEKLSKLKHDMGRDKALEKIGQDGGDPTEEYDEILEKQNYTWFNAPWLFAECYLYRLIRSIFARSQHWQQYDPFSTQKVAAFRSSASAILQLSDAVEPLIKKAEAAAHSNEDISEGLHVIFRELVQTSLWGNATDLSLLTHLTHADLQTLQAGGLGTKAQAEREHFILTGLGGIDKAWQSLLSQKKQSATGQSRVDIILDNSGFELFTDLLLGDFIVTSGLADQVVFHPKDMPWFVSDVTPSDFLFTLEALQSNDFFTKTVSRHGQQDSILPPRTSRSSSRQRQMIADLEDFEGQRRDMSPAGSRVLRMEAVPEEGRDKEAYGSHHLQHHDESQTGSGRAEEAQDALLNSRGRPRQSGYSVGGSRNLQLDPSFFQNARSHTVSPSRSYVMDSSSMQSFSSFSSHSRDRSSDRVEQRGGGDDDRRGRSLVSEHTSSTQRLATRWQSYLQSGKFVLSMPLNTPLGGSAQLHSLQGGQGDFWTSFHNYPSLPLVAPQLHAALSSSRLVISKGDLNYRKWCSDAQWPFDTPFVDVLGPVKGTLNLLVLRTNKADVCVGVPKDRLATVEKEDPEWRVDGKYAVIEFMGKN